MKRIILPLLLLCLALPACAEWTAEGLYVTFDNPPAYDESLLKLVNKTHKLTSKDKPDDLRAPDIPIKKGCEVTLRDDAAAALEEMYAFAQAEGLQFVAVSGFRSYGSQAAIYTRAVENKGKAQADRVNARAGCSEHQLGLAIDLSCKAISYNLNARFTETDEGKWLKANCAQFGFILRYTKEWESVTGYMNEPWHFRYVGVEHAMLVTEMNVPFETYCAYLELAGKQ